MRKLIILLLFLTTNVFAQTEKEIDLIFSDWNNISVPGGSVNIIKNGEKVFSKGYGSADLEHNVANSPETVYYIGSVSKQFVTFCILLLEEQGKIKLDDDIHKYFPDFPDYGAALTIRNFIHHTSGVRDYLTLMALKDRNYLDHIRIEEVYNIIKAQNKLNFTPGDQYLYSNSCYFMLALIIEKASGKTIREYADEEIFKPLGMKNSLFYDNNRDLINNKAFSYQKTKSGWANLINRFDLVGSGGVYSTVEDMYLWDQNFYKNKLGNGGQDIINKMHEEGILNNGKSSGYAFAIVNGNYQGLNTVSHGGSLAGYRSVQLRFPDQQFSVTILANRNDASPTSKAYKIADLYLQEFYEQQNQDTEVAIEVEKTISLSSKKLMLYEGHYWNEKVGFKAEVRADEGSLKYSDRSGEYELNPISKTEFVAKTNSKFRALFEQTQEGKYQMTIIDRGTFIMQPFEPVNYSNLELSSFIGSWYSSELDMTYNLIKEDDGIRLYLGTVEDEKLEVIKRNTFRAGRLIIDFNEEATSFLVKAGRVRDLLFVRK